MIFFERDDKTTAILMHPENADEEAFAKEQLPDNRWVIVDITKFGNSPAGVVVDFDKKIADLDSMLRRQTENILFNADINSQLRDIDTKKVRALTDGILTGNMTCLSELETHAAALRAQLRK